MALAVDETGVWVASADAAVITHLDPASGVTLAAPVVLPSRPAGIAVAEGSVWVANADGTVTRIDAASNRVTATVDVGGSLSAIAATTSAVWVADRAGHVLRLDPVDPAAPPTRIATVSAPATLALVGADVWVGAGASIASHRGGTLRIVSDSPTSIDPLGIPIGNATTLEADGLVAYRRVGGSLGSELLPDLAVALPRPTDGGRTYTFQLRPDVVYSSGDPVMAGDFRRAIERSFQVAAGPFGAVGNFFFVTIAGADACTRPDAAPVERCDLSSGIVTDDAARTVAFHLVTPDPEFLDKLALTYAYPVPDGVPMNGALDGAFPGTGPYTVASVSENELRLTRNPHFDVWDAEVRPDGFPDEIVWTYGLAVEERISRIESGAADFMPSRGPNRVSPEALAQLGVEFPAQLRFGSIATQGLLMNTALPPFETVEARQALSLAIDRTRVADLYGATPGVAISCQFLPSATTGYAPYCPYTADPDAGGQWHAPDLAAALRLVDASGTAGAAVVVGPVSREEQVPLRDYVAEVLGQLGYDVTVDPAIDEAALSAANEESRMQVTVGGWLPDFDAPSNFFGWMTCAQSGPPMNHCDPEFDALYAEAFDLQGTDPVAAIPKSGFPWSSPAATSSQPASVTTSSTPHTSFCSTSSGLSSRSPNGWQLTGARSGVQPHATSRLRMVTSAAPAGATAVHALVAGPVADHDRAAVRARRRVRGVEDHRRPRFLAGWVTHAESGYAVTPASCTRRVESSMKNRT